MNKHNKTETKSQIQKGNKWLSERRRVWEWEKQVRGIKKYKLRIKK